MIHDDSDGNPCWYDWKHSNYCVRPGHRVDGEVWIVGVAIKADGKIYAMGRPKRHHHILRWFRDIGLKNGTSIDQGFLTNRGEYIGRKEAKILALQNDQYLTDEQYAQKHNQPVGSRYKGSDLFSEDLW